MRALKLILLVLFAAVLALYGVYMLVVQRNLDTTPPVISCDSDLMEISVTDGDEALLSGVSANDNRDGDISDQVLIKSVSKLITADTAKVTYIVFDSSDNMATASRLVRYTDYVIPHFSLSAPLVFNLGSTITLSDKIAANDVLDGDISSSIKIASNMLSNATESTYSITVQVTNSMGDTAMVPLSVIVRSVSEKDPVVTLSKYLVYISEGSDFSPETYLESVQKDGASKADSALKTRVLIDSKVNSSTAGAYEVLYTFSNDNGRSASAILTVVVE